MVLPDQFQRQAAMFEALATTAARPLKAFSDHQAARNWLDTMSARPAAAQSTKYEELVVSRHTESVGLLSRKPEPRLVLQSLRQGDDKKV